MQALTQIWKILNTNVSLQNYVIEQIPTESTAGEVLLYINKSHSYKTRPDLVIYKPKKLESIFAEVVLPKKSNFIVGCIYKHPCMDIWTFNNHYLNPLLDNLSKEANKTIVLLGDFNIDLLNFDTSEYVSTFLDDLAPNSIQPQILEIISSLDYDKAVRINRIPIKILKIAKNELLNTYALHITYLSQQVLFQTVWKSLKSHQFTKRVPNLSVLTIDLSPCYQILIKQ